MLRLCPVRVDSVDCHLGGSRLRLAILASRMLRSTSAAHRPHRIRARTHAGRGVRACVQASEDSEPRGRCDARRVTAHCARTKTTPERARRRLRPTSSCPLAAPTERSDVAHSHGTLPRLPFPQSHFEFQVSQSRWSHERLMFFLTRFCNFTTPSTTFSRPYPLHRYHRW